jgi:hypothetical protein
MQHTKFHKIYYFVLFQQKYFDSGDYQMAKQKGPAKIPTTTTVVPPANLGHPTGDAIPTPESVPTRKTSIIQSKLASPAM